MEITAFATRLSAALVFGIAIGVERQWRQKSAGLRTNSLVSLGSAAYILLSILIIQGSDGAYTGDVSRVASQIVTGIGFLGAGVIMKDGFNVQGLNTAATIWCSGAVGALCGAGLYAEAGIVTSAVMLTHVILRPVGQKLSAHTFTASPSTQIDYLITIKCKSEVENHIRILMMQMLGTNDKVLLKSLTSDDTNDAVDVTIMAAIQAIGRQDSLIEQAASRLTIEEKVVKISWEITGTESEL